MPDSSPSTVHEPQRGSVLLAALGVTLLAAVLLGGAAYDAGMRLTDGDRRQESALALICAQAGLENARLMATETPSLVTAAVASEWISSKAVSYGSVSVSASDPGDGLVALNGAALSSSADTVRLSATGQVGGISRTLVADFVRWPHDALRYAVFSRGRINFSNVVVEGRVRAHDAINTAGTVDIYGDITTLQGCSIAGGLVDADTDTFYTASATSLPAPDFAWFTAAGKRITLPPSRTINNAVLAPGYTTHGTASPEGFYYIDGAGGTVTLTNVYVRGTLAIVNATTVSIGPAASSTLYYHASADPDRYPALVVQGHLTMRVRYATASVSFGGASEVIETGVTGLIFCTGDFSGPQTGVASGAIRVDGAIVAAQIDLIGAGTLIQHDIDLDLTPLAEFVQPGLRLVPHTRREL